MSIDPFLRGHETLLGRSLLSGFLEHGAAIDAGGSLLGWLPESVSTYSGRIDDIILLIALIVGVWFIAAEAVLLFFLFAYRKKDGQRAAYLKGTTGRQAAWIVAPVAAILLFDVAIDLTSAQVWADVKQHLPSVSPQVRIIGKQFVWRFIHAGPDGKLGTRDDLEAQNQLHVVAGKPVHFELQSDDVIHSFFVPNLRLKQDAVPGRTIHGWFEVTREGSFQIACAELCGFGHGNMLGFLHAESPSKFEAWMKEAAEDSEDSEESAANEDAPAPGAGTTVTPASPQE
jgi:cytochrome c oxidase subunit 2